MDIHCDQCNATMINGVFCHESGCPNMAKVWDPEYGWIQVAREDYLEDRDSNHELEE